MPHSLGRSIIDSHQYFKSLLAVLQDEAATLAPIRDQLLAVYEEYDANTGNPAELSRVAMSKAQKAALIGMYKVLNSSKTDPANLRGEILLALSCPYCDHGEPHQIDHFLPKELWPEFSVHIANLVPSCGVCNLAKAQRYAGEWGWRYPHPYFDEHPEFTYLHMHACFVGKNVQYIYNLAFEPGIDKGVKRKISQLYSDLDLLHRFGRRAVSKVNSLEKTLLQQFASGGSKAVKTYLKILSTAAVHPAGRNHWDTVLLHSLAADATFCTLKHWQRSETSSVEVNPS